MGILAFVYTHTTMMHNPHLKKRNYEITDSKYEKEML